jgi:hypothetical protein
MSYPLSACFFIKDCFTGAFCAFESLAAALLFSSEVIILDLESTDGTWEALQEIARHNPKVELHRRPWPKIDAGVFADLANDLIQMCAYENVWYFQADEIWHQNLLLLMEDRFKASEFDLAFWRIQFANNFGYVKWFPHLVHRVGQKGRFNFVGDGMTSDRTWDAKICSNYDGGYFPKWGGMHPMTLPVQEMITDISLLGGFRDNIIERRSLHAPFWHEEPTIPYYYRETGQQIHRPASQWAAEAMSDSDWIREESPFNLPEILRWHVGRTRYELRDE